MAVLQGGTGGDLGLGGDSQTRGPEPGNPCGTAGPEPRGGIRYSGMTRGVVARNGAIGMFRGICPGETEPKRPKSVFFGLTECGAALEIPLPGSLARNCQETGDRDWEGGL